MKVFILLISIFINLSAYEFYEDKSSSLALKDILNVEFNKRDNLNFGRTESTIWIKFDIENKKGIQKDIFLHIELPFLEYIDLYKVENSIKVSRNGVKVAIEKRDFKNHNIIFKINLKPQAKKSLFLRVKSNSAMLIMPYFYESESEFYNFFGKYNLFLGVVFAILVVLLFYNFSIYLYLRERLYLNYVLYTFTFLIYQLFFTTYILNYFNFENYIQILVSLSIIPAIFAVYFVRELLETKKNLPTFDKILFIYTLSLMAEVIISFINPILSAQIRHISLIFSSILIFIIAIVAIKKGVVVAKAFLFAWSIFLATFITTGLTFTGVIPTNFFLSHSLQIGSLIEIVLFSFILAYKINLLKEEKIKASNELREKNELLHFQSKFATIGETLCNIEHQWRTPLSQIGSKITELDVHLDYEGIPTKEFLTNFTKESNELLEYMSQSVNDFRNFYTPTTKAKEFYIKDAISQAIKLIKFYIDREKIEINFNANLNPKIYGYESEFSQVILNILSNAKDIFIERNILNPKIDIVVTQNINNIEIKIIDNGGGIDSEVIDKIFDPFYSQKLDKSTGLGLYLSKVIIKERMNGNIEVKNIKNGSEFKITLHSTR